MQKKKDYTKMFLGVICLVIVIVGIFALAGGFTKEVTIEKEVPVIDVQAIETAINNAVAMKDITILDLQTKLNNLAAEVDVEEEIAEAISDGYLIDKIFLEGNVDEVLSDRELNLFDGEVTFDEEDYDAEEVFTLDSLELSINEKDFEDNAYLAIPSDGVIYKIDFENALNTSLITEEETLVFNFLGNEVEVSNWDGNELTFSEGTEFFISEGEAIAVGESTLVLEMIMEDSIYVTVDGVGERIDEGKTSKVNGIEVFAKEVLYVGYAGPVSKATLVVGEDVEKTVEDGEEYSEDSIWEWEINANSIGIVLNENFVELDDEYPVLSEGDTLCLPNDYVCVIYNGLTEEDSELYSFEMDEEDGLDYVKVDGSFIDGLNDYDKLYINATGIYDEDYELIDTSIEIGDTELTLKIGANYFKINNVKLNYNLTDIKVDGISIASEEDNYLNEYGIVIDNPEDSCEDQEFSLTVPENKLEGTVTIY